MGLMLTTAGESHGVAMTAMLIGLPAGLVLDVGAIDAMLTRRQGGYGRGGRMTIEEDRVEVEAGLIRGKTLGSPLLLRVRNRDHRIDTAPEVTRPRPGHADLAGMMKYGTRDAREVLERASARETAARVAAGAVAAQFLLTFGVEVLGFVRALGPIRVGTVSEEPGELRRLRDASPFFSPDPAADEEMRAAVDAARAAGDTLGGVFEVRAFGVPPGLGTCASHDARLDARLAAAVMSIPAVKGVEIGLGFEAAARRGSEVHDPIVPGTGRPRRASNRAGGIEGGITNGEPVIVRGAMKPLSTLMRGLPTVDARTGAVATGATERSDVTAVPAASVVGEAVVSLILADALLAKTGGDSLAEVRRNLEAHLRAAEALFPPAPPAGSPSP
ncbi:MAG: chorismate synthase [Planctomycetes bacterium]|jgi:chorismate synthase|nr:chorismate synthase [Planctomycetota bacterium]